MKVEHRGRVISASAEVAAPAHRVWLAWGDPERVREWLPDEAEGRFLPGEQVRWRFRGFANDMAYEVYEARPAKWALLKAAMPGGGEGWLELKLEARAESTVVEVVNSGLPEGEEWDELCLGIESGWRNVLEYLKMYLTSYWKREKQAAVAFKEGEFECAAAMGWMLPGVRRGRWLDVADNELELLWDLPRHVVYRWEAVEGTLECNAFQGAGGRAMIAVRVQSWAGRAGAELEARLEACAERLVKLLVS